MTREDVQLIERTTPFQGYNRVDLYRLRYRLFEGGWSQVIEREVFERGHGVIVIPFDPILDRLVFVEQLRPGAYAALFSPWVDADASPWTVECVAGNIRHGEDPEAVARRETEEEAGCAVRELVPVGQFLISPSGSSQSVFVYCGRVDASAAGGIHGVPEEGENTRVLVLPVGEAFEWLDCGRINGAGTVIALQWLRHNYGNLRRRWRPVERV